MVQEIRVNITSCTDMRIEIVPAAKKQDDIITVATRACAWIEITAYRFQEQERTVATRVCVD